MDEFDQADAFEERYIKEGHIEGVKEGRLLGLKEGNEMGYEEWHIRSVYVLIV
jgi:hypothetical protein